MAQLNIEIKARLSEHERVRNILNSLGAEFKGTDHQTDTYFIVKHGRMKLRQGNIENSLVYYDREKAKGPKQSDVTLIKIAPDSAIKEILSKSLGTLAVVNKTREIYFIGNVKFHLDSVEGLGTFVEIEAIDKNGNIGKEKLFEQCTYYMKLFEIEEKDLLQDSYSDMISEKNRKKI